MTTTPAGDNGKNAILRYFIVATSSNGATSVVSLGEIDPFFGGTSATPDFVAYSGTGGLPALVFPSRTLRDGTSQTLWVCKSWLSRLFRQDRVASPVGLKGNVNKPGSYTLSDLQGFTPATETVNGDTYTGAEGCQGRATASGF